MDRNYDANNELAKLKKQLADAIFTQELMKAGNKIIKSAKGKDCTAALLAIGMIEKLAVEIQKPDFAGRIGFPSYKLTNNNADIKRWSAKVELLERKATAESTGGNQEIEFDGGTVVYNYGVDRLQLVYDAKPDEDTRKEIKGYGFNWAPSEDAWQRQLTDSACRAASRLLKIEVPAPGLRPDRAEEIEETEARINGANGVVKFADLDISFQYAANLKIAQCRANWPVTMAEYNDEDPDAYFDFTLPDGVLIVKLKAEFINEVA